MQLLTENLTKKYKVCYPIKHSQSHSHVVGVIPIMNPFRNRSAWLYERTQSNMFPYTKEGYIRKEIKCKTMLAYKCLVIQGEPSHWYAINWKTKRNEPRTGYPHVVRSMSVNAGPTNRFLVRSNCFRFSHQFLAHDITLLLAP